MKGFGCHTRHFQQLGIKTSLTLEMLTPSPPPPAPDLDIIISAVKPVMFNGSKLTLRMARLEMMIAFWEITRKRAAAVGNVLFI